MKKLVNRFNPLILGGLKTSRMPHRYLAFLCLYCIPVLVINSKIARVWGSCNSQLMGYFKFGAEFSESHLKWLRVIGFILQLMYLFILTNVNNGKHRQKSGIFFSDNGWLFAKSHRDTEEIERKTNKNRRENWKKYAWPQLHTGVSRDKIRVSLSRAPGDVLTELSMGAYLSLRDEIQGPPEHCLGKLWTF